MDFLIGKKIKEVRPMTADEIKAEHWEANSPCICIVLENDAVIYSSKDYEGNGPGALFITHNNKNYTIS